MQRRTFRSLSRAVTFAVILAVGSAVWQSYTAGTTGQARVVQTSWGPLSSYDRDLLVKVRLFCLWEMPTGQQAQQQALSPAVREALGKISTQQDELDQKVRNAANDLGVLLPSSPSAQQIAWMREISSKTSSEYDRNAVQRLRESAGLVLPLVSQVQVGTRNDLIRAFAAESQVNIVRQIGYLEGTGLVDYSALPESGLRGSLSSSTGWRDLVVPGLTAIACLLLAVGIWATVRGRHLRRSAELDDPLGISWTTRA